jgi:archaellum component FlaC
MNMMMLTERCSEKYMKKLIGRTEIEDGLKRLDKLTQEEARMAAAQNLKVTHMVAETVVAIDNRVDDVDGRVAGVSDQVAGVDDRVANVSDQVAGVEGQVANVSDQVAGIDDRVAGVSDQVAGVDDRVQQMADEVKRMPSLNLSADL